MEKRISEMEARAAKETISAGRKSELVKKQQSYANHYKQRKRIAERIIDAISESAETPKKKLMVDSLAFENFYQNI